MNSGRKDMTVPVTRKDLMIVNMGPHHPSMHGVLRLILTLDGEDVIDCEPILGYLHRGMEKIAENRTIIQYLPYVTRWDYLATMFTEAITVNAPEKFAPFGHLWTMCENCETSIYKQYAKKNKYICQHCGYHLQMESFDRIEFFIDAGTWDSMDENMVSTDPYEILRKNLAPASDDSSEFMKSQEAK
jgi:hypothetical protein